MEEDIKPKPISGMYNPKSKKYSVRAASGVISKEKITCPYCSHKNAISHIRGNVHCCKCKRDFK